MIKKYEAKREYYFSINFLTSYEVDNQKSHKVKVMDRNNPEWIGKILIRTIDTKTNKTTLSLSSTSQTRESAYKYLVSVSLLNLN